MKKKFSLDYKYYESKKAQNCQFFDLKSGFWQKTCADQHAYSGVYAMRLENGIPLSFKDEMNISGYYYKNKFFTRIVIQYDVNKIISQLTFYPDYNEDPNILFIDAIGTL